MGYKDPPKSSQFRKGKSGNPGGRPRGRHKQPPCEAVLSRMVTVHENGEKRLITAAEAFMLKLVKYGLEGNTAIRNMALTALEKLQSQHQEQQDRDHRVSEITLVALRSGSVNPSLQSLRMATKLDRYNTSARIMLESRMVQRALERLHPKRLDRDEQQIVFNATRTPKKVNWPDWWEVCKRTSENVDENREAKANEAPNVVDEPQPSEATSGLVKARK